MSSQRRNRTPSKHGPHFPCQVCGAGIAIVVHPERRVRRTYCPAGHANDYVPVEGLPELSDFEWFVATYEPF